MNELISDKNDEDHELYLNSEINLVSQNNKNEN